VHSDLTTAPLGEGALPIRIITTVGLNKAAMWPKVVPSLIPVLTPKAEPDVIRASTIPLPCELVKAENYPTLR
jgi:hypothetical protein